MYAITLLLSAFLQLLRLKSTEKWLKDRQAKFSRLESAVHRMDDSVAPDGNSLSPMTLSPDTTEEVRCRILRTTTRACLCHAGLLANSSDFLSLYRKRKCRRVCHVLAALQSLLCVFPEGTAIFSSRGRTRAVLLGSPSSTPSSSSPPPLRILPTSTLRLLPIRALSLVPYLPSLPLLSLPSPSSSSSSTPLLHLREILVHATAVYIRKPREVHQRDRINNDEVLH